MLTRFFEKGDNLFAFDAGESFEELLDRIASLQMIEQTLHGHASASKDRFAAEDFGILRYDAAHDLEITVKAHLFQVTKQANAWAYAVTVTSSSCYDVADSR
jgi:hypothetical protein